MVSHTSQGVAKAHHDPAAGGWRPIECSVGPHFGSQILDVSFANRVSGSDRRRRVELKTPQVGEASLLLEAADARARMQYQFRYLKVGIRFRCTEIAERILHIKGQFAEARRRLVCKCHAKEAGGHCGESDRMLLPPIIGDVDQFTEGLTVIADFRTRNE